MREELSEWEIHVVEFWPEEIGKKILGDRYRKPTKEEREKREKETRQRLFSSMKGMDSDICFPTFEVDEEEAYKALLHVREYKNPSFHNGENRSIRQAVGRLGEIKQDELLDLWGFKRGEDYFPHPNRDTIGGYAPFDSTIFGKRVDVKTVHARGFPLPHYSAEVRLADMRRADFDVAWFGRFDPDTFLIRFVGWMGRKEFLREGERLNKGDRREDGKIVEEAYHWVRIFQLNPMTPQSIRRWE